MERITFFDAHPPRRRLKDEVLAGLAATPKRLSPKLFYDEAGSRLFDAICRQPEYYLTRAELAILERHAAEIGERVGKGCVLVEPGSGSSAKVRRLLDVLRPAAYVPIDICAPHMLAAARGLTGDYPWLSVHAICADFHQIDDLELPPGGRRVAFFPGSTIGNLEPPAAQEFLARLGALVGPGGVLLIGVDLRKDPQVLHAAYNDSAGATAAFNLNLLARLNRELGAGFSARDFFHRAFYNPGAGRVEMHLVSRRRHTVAVDGAHIELAAGEHIHTENSYKYGAGQFAALARGAGLRVERVWVDARGWFSLQWLGVGEGG